MKPTLSFQSTPEPSGVDAEACAQWRDAKLRLKTIEAECAVLRDQLAQQFEALWLDANRAEKTSSVEAHGVRYCGVLRAKVLPAIPDKAKPAFSETCQVTIDLDTIAPKQRQAVLDAIAKLDLPPKAVSVEIGFRAKPDALHVASRISKTVEQFVRENAGYTPTLTSI